MKKERKVKRWGGTYHDHFPLHVEEEGVVIPLLLVVHIFGKKECPTHTLNNEALSTLSLGPNSASHKKGLSIYYEGHCVSWGSLSLDRGIGPHSRKVFKVKDRHHRTRTPPLSPLLFSPTLRLVRWSSGHRNSWSHHEGNWGLSRRGCTQNLVESDSGSLVRHFFQSIFFKKSGREFRHLNPSRGILRSGITHLSSSSLAQAIDKNSYRNS